MSTTSPNTVYDSWMIGNVCYPIDHQQKALPYFLKKERLTCTTLIIYIHACEIELYDQVKLCYAQLKEMLNSIKACTYYH